MSDNRPVSAYELKQRANLREIAAHCWGRPERERAAYAVYASRWRDDGKRPAFTVYDTHFKDYGGTGISGDVFDFIMLEMGLDFKRAVQWLAQYLGGNAHPETYHVPTHQQTTHSEPPSATWQTAARAAISHTQQILWQTPAALDYLRQVRGLTDETIKRAGYGYNPDWLPVDYVNPRTDRKINLPPGIIEPWYADGVLWAVRVRCRVGNLAEALNIPPDQFNNGDPLPKYLNLTGSKQHGALYNADAITPGCDLIIVEGGFDARLVEQTLEEQSVVVTFGSATNHPGRRRLKQIQQASSITLLLDADEAGQQAQLHLAQAINNHVRTVTLPPGQDVTDFIQSGGDLQYLLATAAYQPWWHDGVPDTVRSALLNYFRPVTAPVVELINTAVLRGLLNPDNFTVDDLLTANTALDFNISQSSLRRVVTEVTDTFFSQLETKSLAGAHTHPGRTRHHFRLLPIEDIKSNIVAWAKPRIYEKHHPAEPLLGQGIIAQPTPAMLVTMGYDPDESIQLAKRLSAALEPAYDTQEGEQSKTAMIAFNDLIQLTRKLENTTSTPLPEGWPLNNGTSYRAAFLRATNDPKERRSRRQIRKLLGVANGSVDSMVERAGLEKENPQGSYETAQITRSSNVDKQIRHHAGKLRGYPLSILMQRENGRSREVPYLGAESTQTITEAIKNGDAVHIRYQVANRYVTYTDSPPDVAKTSPTHPEKRKFIAVNEPKAYRPRRTTFGPLYDREWLRDQWTLALLRMDRLQFKRKPRLMDTQTGEILNPGDDSPDPLTLLYMLLPELRL